MGIALSTPVALADENAAETLFQEGLAAMTRKDFNVACEAFTKSNKADPSPGTQINLAICYEKQKKWASAWTWYRSAAGLAQQRQQGAREQSANEAANRIKPSLHYVIVNVKDAPADMVVKRDGSEVVTQLAGAAVPLPIDPGDHLFEVSATGKKTATKTLTCADNTNTDTVEIALENAPVEATPPTGPNGPTSYPVTVQGNDGSSQRTVGFIVGGAGILAGIAGVGVYILASNEASQRDAQRKIAADTSKTGNERAAATSSVNSHNSAANNDQLIAIILGISAGVMIAGGVVLYLTAPKKPTTGLVVRPMPIATPTWQGMGLTGTF
jgi:hypothetical protein